MEYGTPGVTGYTSDLNDPSLVDRVRTNPVLNVNSPREIRVETC